MTELPWCLYVLLCSDDTLYTGISNDVPARVKKHNLGKGAKYTRSRLPVRLLECATVGDKGAALRFEHRFKKLSRAQKLSVLRGGLSQFLAAQASEMNAKNQRVDKSTQN